jgi:hypothetical protein
MQRRLGVMLAVLVACVAVGTWADETPVTPVAPEPAATSDPKAGQDEPPKPDGHCDRCGSCQSVRSVCVAVPVEREKTKICWSYRCEQICIPGPSIFCGETCECDECGPWWKQWWKPTCAHMITRRVPVKTEVTRKVPGFEWQVQERCCSCNPQCSTPKTSWLSCLLHPFGTK